MENEIEETIERGWIADWADYDDADEREGCDFWNNDGSVTDYAGMTVDEVEDELSSEGWERDDETQALYDGTDRGNVLYMIWEA